MPLSSTKLLEHAGPYKSARRFAYVSAKASLHLPHSDDNGVDSAWCPRRQLRKDHSAADAPRSHFRSLPPPRHFLLRQQSVSFLLLQDCAIDYCRCIVWFRPQKRVSRRGLLRSIEWAGLLPSELVQHLFHHFLGSPSQPIGRVVEACARIGRAFRWDQHSVCVCAFVAEAPGNCTPTCFSRKSSKRDSVCRI